MKFNRGSSSLSAATLLCVALYQLQCAQAFMFDVPASGKKCFSDMLDKDILVVANYEILGVPQDQPSRFMVVATDPDGVVEYSRTDLSKAKMAFTASKEGMHTLCFHNHGRFCCWCKTTFLFLGGVTVALELQALSNDVAPWISGRVRKLMTTGK
eukprot:gb/GECG01008412.1/.p1 GENE.gb/GECG01008412.1/~~gb/GECG01008412.1/.p1  ORF type:complete len:155 (+),score=18.82 gb/GECG01008412.1/:1-465(+)